MAGPLFGILQYPTTKKIFTRIISRQTFMTFLILSLKTLRYYDIQFNIFEPPALVDSLTQVLELDQGDVTNEEEKVVVMASSGESRMIIL